MWQFWGRGGEDTGACYVAVMGPGVRIRGFRSLWLKSPCSVLRVRTFAFPSECLLREAMTGVLAVAAVIFGWAAAKPTLRLGLSSADFCMGYHLTACGYVGKLAWDSRWPPLMPDSPSDFDVEVRVVNDMCAPGGNFNGVLDMLQSAAGPPVHALLGEMMTPGCESSDRLTAAFATAHVASGCVGNQLRDRVAFPTFATMMSPNFAVTAGVAKLAARLQEQKGEVIRKASIFFTDESLGWATMAALQDNLKMLGMGNMSLVAIPIAFNPGGPDSQWAASLSKALVVNSHVNFLALQATIAMRVLSAIHNAGITGPQRVWFDCIGSTVSGSNPNFDGMAAVFMNSRGPRFKSLFEDFWTTLTPANFSGVAGGYYDGNHSAGPLAGRPKLPSSLFAPNIEPGRYAQEIVAHLNFDAVMLFIHLFDRHVKNVAAVNGTNPETSFRKLSTIQQLMRSMKVAGVSGSIVFDKILDRMGELSILNRQGLSMRSFGTCTMPAMTMTYTGQWLFANGSAEIPALNPTPCPQGSFIDQNTGQCLLCPFGMFGGSLDAAQCFFCAPGQSSNSPGSAVCDLCEKGYAQPSAGRRSCEACPPGFVAGDMGASECKPCLSGGFVAGPGQAECLYCDVGSFSNESGQSSCTQCPGGMTTQQKGSRSVIDCACPQGEYCAGTYPQCICKSCPEGMTCNFGSMAENLVGPPHSGERPLVKPGFYTTKERPLSVYFCRNKGDCPGGDPQVCKNNLVGLVCAVCEEGWSMKGDTCVKCSEGNTGVLVIAPIVGIIICIITYYSGNRPVEVNADMTLGASCVFGFAVTIFQIFASFDQLTVPWPGGVKDFFGGSKFLVINPRALSAECMVNGSTVVRQYLVRFFLPTAVLVAMLICYAAAKVLGRCNVLPERRRWQLAKVINSICQIYNAIFIALTAIAAVAFQCYSHPNGESSLVQYPTVICGSDDHRAIMAMSVILLITFVAPFIGVQIWANIHTIKVRANPRDATLHTMRFRFMMYRFRPDVWWWGTIFTIRQTLLAFAPLLEPDDPHTQCVFIVAVLTIYTVNACFFWPWKSDELNFLDAVSMTLIVILVAAVSSVMPASALTAGHLRLMTAILILIAIFAAFFAIYCVLMVCSRGTLNLIGIFGVHEQRLKKPESLAHLAEDLYKLCGYIAAAPAQDLVESLLFLNSYDLRTVRGCIDVFKASTVASIARESDRQPTRLLKLPHSSCRLSEAKRRSSYSELFATVDRFKGELMGELSSGGPFGLVTI